MRAAGGVVAGAGVVAVAAALALGGGCKRAASLEFQPKAPIELENDKGKKVPQVVAFDKDGQALEEPPKVKITAEPAGIVTIDADRIVPAKNGEAKLVATLVEGGGDVKPAELPVRVSVVDDIRVTCPETGCALHVGENLQLDAVAHGLGERIESSGIEWASSDPGKATVNAQGQVAGVAAGTVVITTKVGKKSTETKLEVHPAVDEVRILCPWPPLVVDVKKNETAPPQGDRSCEVLMGEDVHIDVVTLAHGEVVTGERVDWHSSDPSVRVVGGTVTGDHPGGAMIEVKANGVLAEMPFSVGGAVRGLGSGHCAGGEASLTNRFTMAFVLKNAAGDKQDESREYRCETTAAKRCLDEATREIGHALEKLTFDLKNTVAFGEMSLDERARRCCCRR